MSTLKAIAEMHLENEALFWEIVRVNKKHEEDFNSLSLLESSNSSYVVRKPIFYS